MGNGQYVGKPFQGIEIRLCQEEVQDSLIDVASGDPGEIILCGSQLDKISGYLKRPELGYKFVLEASEGEECIKQHYRTGDRGIFDQENGGLRILGRILGEEGMVKVNGVRVELGEIENALVDEIQEADESSIVVLNCMAKVTKIPHTEDRSEVRAYCVLSDSVQKEVGITDANSSIGVMVNSGPLLTLLRARSEEKLKPACIPKAFIVIKRLPLSPTGKRDRNGLPDIDACTYLNDVSEGSVHLSEYGVAGSKVAQVLIDSLNLQQSQEAMLTTTATFSMLGGDSLAATRVTRALFAYHHEVDNNRFLGGEFGKLSGPFDVMNLLRAKNLGAYVDMLDSQSVCKSHDQKEERKKIDTPTSSLTASSSSKDGQGKDMLYDALLQATSLGQSSIAMNLLLVGADPNHGKHSGRLGKVSHRLEQRTIFRSSPLHLACLQGNDILVAGLLERGAKFNSPDASGLFPLHLASSGVDGEDVDDAKQDSNRRHCVELLFQAGAPMTMRDGNKQSVLHTAARAGHCQVLKFVMATWKEKYGSDIPLNHFFNWNDRWYSKYFNFSLCAWISSVSLIFCLSL